MRRGKNRNERNGEIKRLKERTEKIEGSRKKKEKRKRKERIDTSRVLTKCLFIV